MEFIKTVIDIGSTVLQSDLAVALVLLLLLVLQNRRITRFERKTELTQMECEASVVLARSHRDTFKNIATEYRALYLGVVTGKREASPELHKIDEHFFETRRAVHEETKRSAQKLHASVEELKKHIEKEFL